MSREVRSVRVIDMIAMLEAHDPVAPVEVWIEELGGKSESLPARFLKHRVSGARQITPLYLKSKGQYYEPSDENPPLPVVVFVEYFDERDL